MKEKGENNRRNHFKSFSNPTQATESPTTNILLAPEGNQL